MIPFLKRGAGLFPALVVLSACAHRAVRSTSASPSISSVSTSTAPVAAYVRPAPSSATRAGKTADPYLEAAQYAQEAERSSKQDEDSSKSVFADPPVWAGGVIILGILIAIIAMFG
jgi:hypothetical protein